MASELGVITFTKTIEGEKAISMDFGKPIRVPKFTKSDVEYMLRAFQLILDKGDEY